MRSRVGFALWFAWRDLGANSAWKTSLSCSFTIFVMIFLTLLVWGAVNGYEAIRRHKIESDPLARCMSVGNPHVEEQRISQDKIDTLRRLLNDKLSTERLKGCFPFSILSDSIWQSKSENDESAYPTITGRTLVQGDPLLDSFKFIQGRPFKSADEDGIVATEEMLKKLGFTAQNPPPALNYRAPDGSLVQMALRGVIEGNFIFGQGYVVNHVVQVNIDADHRNVPAAIIQTGAVPKEWPTPDHLPPDVADALNTFGILEPTEIWPQGKKCWRLEARFGANVIANWHIYVNKIGTLMERAGFPGTTDFALITPDVPRAEHDDHAKEAQQFDMATVYVKNLNDLSIVASVCKANHIYYNSSILTQLEHLGRDSQDARTALVSVLALIVLMGIVNLIIMQNLVAQQKAAEVGMLKAMGMGKSLLRGVYLCETGLLFAVAAVPAYIAVWPLGRWLAPMILKSLPEEKALAFQLSGLEIASVFAGVALICSWATLQATKRARQQSPLSVWSGSGT